jgi:hypothetical protein
MGLRCVIIVEWPDFGSKMKIYNQIIRKIFFQHRMSWWIVLLSFFFSMITASLIYLFFIQSPAPGKRDFIEFIFIFGFITIIYILLIPLFIKKMKMLNPVFIGFILGISLLAGFGLALGINNRLPVYYLSLPISDLEIQATGDKNPLSKGSAVQITDFQTGLSEISFKEFIQTGEWQKVGKKLKSDHKQPAFLIWHGRAYDKVNLKFQSNQEAGFVKVTLNDEERVIDLYSINNQEVWINIFETAPAYIFLIRYLMIGIGFSLFIVLFSVLIGVNQNPKL